MFEESKRPNYPLVLSVAWRKERSPLQAQNWYRSMHGIFVITELEKHDGKWWLHISFSRRNRLPDYQDIILVKDQFVGADKKAIMVFPKKSEHVNIHPFCLHFYSCEDDGLPDFRRNDQGIVGL